MPATTPPHRPRDEFAVHLDPDELHRQRFAAAVPALPTTDRPQPDDRRSGGTDRRAGGTGVTGRGTPARARRAYAFRRS